MWSESSVSSWGFSVKLIVVSVTSGKFVQAVHADFFPMPSMLDVTSQPVKAWKNGSALHCQFPAALKLHGLEYLYMFTTSETNPQFSKPRILECFEEMNSQNNDIRVNCSEECLLMAIYDSMMELQHHNDCLPPRGQMEWCWKLRLPYWKAQIPLLLLVDGSEMLRLPSQAHQPETWRVHFCSH